MSFSLSLSQRKYHHRRRFVGNKWRKWKQPKTKSWDRRKIFWCGCLSRLAPQQSTPKPHSLKLWKNGAVRPRRDKMRRCRTRDVASSANARTQPTLSQFSPYPSSCHPSQIVQTTTWPGARGRDAKGGTLYFVRIILLSLASISNTLQFTRTNEQQLDITWTHIDVSGFRSMVVVGVHTLLTPCTQNKVYSLSRVQTQRPYCSQCNQKLGSVWSRAVNIQRQHQFFRCNLCRQTRSSASKSKCEVSIFTANENHVYCMLKNFTRLCIWNDRCRQKRDKMANETTAKCSFISENTPTNPINI